jgi:hypothetical protein
MNKIMKYSLVLVFTILLYGCANNRVAFETTTYQYKYMATTGICNYIHLGDKIVPIEFHKKSNKLELDLLNSLPASILYPSNERIYVIGKLHDEIKKTPDRPDMAVSEEYREFELIHWYIVCPFKEYAFEDSNTIIRKSLQPDDIGLGIIGRMFIDVNDFQKEE